MDSFTSSKFGNPTSSQFSSPSATFSSSSESKPDPHTQTFACNFLWATLKSIENTLSKYAWYRLGNYKLQVTFDLTLSFLICSPEQSMTVQLGSVRVSVTSDGGYCVRVNSSSSSFPVFCLEAYLSSFLTNISGETKDT